MLRWTLLLSIREVVYENLVRNFCANLRVLKGSSEIHGQRDHHNSGWRDIWGLDWDPFWCGHWIFLGTPSWMGLQLTMTWQRRALPISLRNFSPKSSMHQLSVLSTASWLANDVFILYSFCLCLFSFPEQYFKSFGWMYKYFCAYGKLDYTLYL